MVLLSAGYKSSWLALPHITPAAVECCKALRCGTNNQNFLFFFQRQEVVIVLHQRYCFIRCIQSQLLVLWFAKIGYGRCFSV